MGELSIWHWLFVIAIALLLFGPKKLPELGKGLAEGIRGFKEGLKDPAPPPTQSSSEQKNNTENKG